MTAQFGKFSPAFSSVSGGGLISHPPAASRPGRVGRSATRTVLGAVLALAASCAGSGSGGDRRSIIDSRDTYDPRSLDPSLATDVPTGRAAGYIFDGPTNFDAAANVKPGPA